MQFESVSPPATLSSPTETLPERTAGKYARDAGIVTTSVETGSLLRPLASSQFSGSFQSSDDAAPVHEISSPSSMSPWKTTLVFVYPASGSERLATSARSP